MATTTTEQMTRRAWVLGIDPGENSVGLAALAVDPPEILAAVSVLHDSGVEHDKTAVSRLAEGGAARRTRRGRRVQAARLERGRAILIHDLGCDERAVDGLTGTNPWLARSALARVHIQDDALRGHLLGVALGHILRWRGWRDPYRTAAYRPAARSRSARSGFAATKPKAIRTVYEHARSGVLSIDPPVVCDPSERADAASTDTDIEIQSANQAEIEQALCGWLGHRLATFLAAFGVCVCGGAFTVAALDYVCDLGALGEVLQHNTSAVRPKQYKDKEGKTKTKVNLLGTKTLQVDVLAELRAILDRQQVSGSNRQKVEDVVFEMGYPVVPVARVGLCRLERGEYRAPTASLEFQEFRIRDSVANLRYQGLPLEAGVQQKLVDTLLQWRYPDAADGGDDTGDSQRPSWAAILGDAGLDVEKVTVGGTSGINGNAPIDQTSAVVEKYLASTPDLPHSLGLRWHSDLLFRYNWVAELSETTSMQRPLAGAGLGEDQVETLRRALPSGRANYSRKALRKLCDEMATTGCDLACAQAALYGISDPRYVLPTLEDTTWNPTVDCNLSAVRKFLASAELRWGPPKRIVVEVARDELKTPKQRMAIQKRNKCALDYWAKVAPELRNGRERNRHLLLEIFDNKCAYCNTPVDNTSVEIDHVVPVRGADGKGSSGLDNLVPSCAQCNAEKSDQTYMQWKGLNKTTAKTDKALERVAKLGYKEGQAGFWRSLARTNKRTGKDQSPEEAFRAWRGGLLKRLKRTTLDEPEDFRRLGVTQYAATALRDRLERYTYDDEQKDHRSGDKKIKVNVWAGSVVSSAKEALGIKTPVLLGRGDAYSKRIDRRHHAVDALVLATLSPLVVQQLLWEQRLRSFGLPLNSPMGAPEWAKAASAQKMDWQRKWGGDTGTLRTLIGDAVQRDAIAVLEPLRLSARNGAAHADTWEALKHQPLVGMTLADASRIADDRLWCALQELVITKAQTYRITNANCELLSREFSITVPPDVDVFPRAGMLLLTPKVGPRERKRRGEHRTCVSAGGIHHARVYAWVSGNGTISYGVLRVYRADLGRYGLGSQKHNLLDYPLPWESASWRASNAGVRAKVFASRAVQIGWIAPGDELEFPSSDACLAACSSERESPACIAQFLEEFPGERRFMITGFEDSRTVNLRPLYVSGEGLTQVGTKYSVRIFNAHNWRAPIAGVLAVDGLTIARRTSLGKPRFKGAGTHSTSLPVSWQPGVVARRLFVPDSST